LPISSRNSVPPSAASKRPTRRRVEPVYAPASAPNSSLSSSSSGSAPAFTRTNGRALRRELAWTISATFSLPAPLGPVMSTGTSARATWSARVTTACIRSLAHTAPQRSWRSASSSHVRRARPRRREFSSCSSRRRSRLRTETNSFSSSHGFAK